MRHNTPSAWKKFGELAAHENFLKALKIIRINERKIKLLSHGGDEIH